MDTNPENYERVFQRQNKWNFLSKNSNEYSMSENAWQWQYLHKSDEFLKLNDQNIEPCHRYCKGKDIFRAK